MVMPESLKGYHCPADKPDLSCYDCQPCPYMHTLCIIYSKIGRKNYKKWEREQLGLSSDKQLELEDFE